MEQTRTAGPARPSLLKMTWPVFIELLLQMLVGNIDQIMLSRYNDTAVAAVVLDLTEKIVAENRITCLMITHNMPDALRLGNRTLMMDSGRIVLDVQGEERAGMTVADLLERFGRSTGRAMDNDRILLSGLE